MIDQLSYALITGPSEQRLKRVPKETVNLVMASPPYDDVRDYGGHGFSMKTFRAIARELFRVLVPGGVVVWVVADQTRNGSESFTSLRQALYFKEIGFNAHDTMIYERSGPPLTHNRYEQAFEYMFIFSKGRPNTFNGFRVPKSHPETKARIKNWSRYSDGSYKKGPVKLTDDRLAGNVWRISVGHVAEEKYAHQHPAIFPEELAHKHIASWSNPGDVILDPFCGSGTTGKMALNMGRKFIGIEINSEYMAIAKRRLADNRAKREYHHNEPTTS